MELLGSQIGAAGEKRAYGPTLALSLIPPIVITLALALNLTWSLMNCSSLGRVRVLKTFHRLEVRVRVGVRVRVMARVGVRARVRIRVRVRVSVSISVGVGVRARFRVKFRVRVRVRVRVSWALCGW